MCKCFFLSPPHITDLSAQVKGIQSRGGVEEKARERKIWHDPERDRFLSAVLSHGSKLKGDMKH